MDGEEGNQIRSWRDLAGVKSDPHTAFVSPIRSLNFFLSEEVT